MPLRLLLTLASLALAASACGSDTSDDRASASGHRRHHGPAASGAPAQRSATPTATPSDAPSAKPSDRQTRRRIPVAAQPMTRRTPLDAHLLAAGDVPALTRPADGGPAWTVVATGPEDQVSVGACQKTSLETIGAVSAVRRTYAPADGTRGHAVQVVAEFADRKSAWRAHEVLRSWHEQCEAEAGPMRTVPVEVGTGENYRVQYDASKAGVERLAAFGIVAHDQYLSLVEIKADRQAFPADRAPARVAVRRISRSFA